MCICVFVYVFILWALTEKIVSGYARNWQPSPPAAGAGGMSVHSIYSKGS